MIKDSALEKMLLDKEKILQKFKDADGIVRRELLEQMLFKNEREAVYLREQISLLSEPFWRGFSDSWMEDEFANTYRISIRQDHQGSQMQYIAELPFLLPNRRTATTYFKRTIVRSLRSALMKFCRDHTVSPLQKASVSFVNYYTPSTERKLRHDNDNTEISGVLNALTGLLIPDDSSLCCDLHLLSRTSERAFTCIIIKEME